MEKNIYIPGDLVHKTFRDESTIKPFTECDYLYDYYRIEPVLLTPEILKKNGWEKRKDMYINDKYQLVLYKRYDCYSAYRHINKKFMWLRCVTLVSDLQHLLFGLDINNEMEV